jgi:alpha-L-fucosidase
MIDDKEEAVLQGIAGWMDANKECIFGTRPWTVFGEGPASEGPVAKVGNFSEGKGKPFTGGDVRFTTRDGTLYVIVLGVPTEDLHIKSLGTAAKLFDGKISKITLLGSTEEVEWSQTAEALTIKTPTKAPNGIAIVFKVTS